MWRSLLCLFAITVGVHVYVDEDPAKSRRTTEAQALAEMEGRLERAVADDAFSGTVIIAKHGEPIFAKAYGPADRERGSANTLETSFNVGSINKMFTAIAVLRLVQDGKIALTDPLGKYVTDYPNREIAERVTIHHLLTHTGGTGDIFDEDWDDYRLTLRTHDDYVKKFGDRGLQHEPGARFEYSNYGFVLLGVVIERVTGKPYYDAVAELVYAPAGMRSTTAPRYDERVGAIGYTRMRGELESNEWVLPYRGMSAGGGWSTSRDLLAFANALARHQLLDAAHTSLAITGKVRTKHGFKYAYGFGEMIVDGVKCIGHNGGFPGVNGDLLACDNGYTIAILANLDPPASGRIASFIARRLPAAQSQAHSR